MIQLGEMMMDLELHRQGPSIMAVARRALVAALSRGGRTLDCYDVSIRSICT